MSTPPDKFPSLTPSDPFELWRQVYDANERAWNAALERAVGSPQFAESQGKMLETILAAQKTVRDNMRTYLETINVPTREDIARLGELLVGLEEKIDQLDDRLANMEAAMREQGRESAEKGAQTGDASAWAATPRDKPTPSSSGRTGGGRARPAARTTKSQAGA